MAPFDLKYQKSNQWIRKLVMIQRSKGYATGFPFVCRKNRPADFFCKECEAGCYLYGGQLLGEFVNG